MLGAPGGDGRNWDDVEPILKAEGRRDAGDRGVLQELLAGRRSTRLLALADKYELLPLGGSDYHGIFGNDERLPGDIPLPDSSIERLLEVARTLPNRALVA